MYRLGRKKMLICEENSKILTKNPGDNKQLLKGCIYKVKKTIILYRHLKLKIKNAVLFTLTPKNKILVYKSNEIHSRSIGGKLQNSDK